MKYFLLREKDEKQENTIFGKITELSDGEGLEDAKWNEKADDLLERFDLEELEEILKIGKSNRNSKADVSVNNVKYSVKEIGAASPAIINHTPRNGFEKVCEIIDSQIDTLDSIIDE